MRTLRVKESRHLDVLVNLSALTTDAKRGLKQTNTQSSPLPDTINSMEGLHVSSNITEKCLSMIAMLWARSCREHWEHCHQSEKKFKCFIYSPLFNQVGQLRTSSHLQLRPSQDKAKHCDTNNNTALHME
jgi:hypothetical protein